MLPGTSHTLKSRPPLAERAAAVANGRTISLEQARAHSRLARFELGGNQFQLFRSGYYDDHELTALVISHLGSAFSGLTVGIHLIRYGRNNCLTVRVAPPGAEFPECLFEPARKFPELFRLRFNLNPARLGVSRLSSNILGKGGQALLALYNLARDAGIPAISYAVNEENTAA